MVATGVSVAFIIGTILRWRVLALTGMFTLSICIFNHQKKNNATDKEVRELTSQVLQDLSLV